MKEQPTLKSAAGEAAIQRAPATLPRTPAVPGPPSPAARSSPAPEAWAPRPQTAKGLDSIFSPRSVAVIGASNNPRSVGHRLVSNILAGGFQGPVYPISLHQTKILGRSAFKNIEQVPEPVDLAVIGVPADAVLSVVEACGRKGVKGLIIVSAGFRESGPAGVEREERLRELVHGSGMRLIGPNCIGVLNTSPSVRLNATFAPTSPTSGRTAIMTQSGALGVALLKLANEVGLGVSQFASMGNKADVSGNDLLLLWENDPNISQVLIYLESFGNPRNFVQIARRLTRSKAVIAVKAGRSLGGAKAARSHTGALAEPDRYIDAFLDQCGVLRVATVEEMFDDALAVALQPLPQGSKVAIVTNSGGPAIMAVDALEAAGLTLAPLTADTGERCRAILPPAATFANPLDLLAGVTSSSFAAALEAVLGDPNVDSVIALCTPIWGDEDALADAIAAAAHKHPRNPLVAVLFGQDIRSPVMRRLISAGVPAYPFPENAVRSLGAMRRIQRFRTRPEGVHPPLAADRGEAKRRIGAARLDAGGWMRPDDALALLETYNIRVARHAFAADPEAAAHAARWIEYPLVLKADAEGLLHKSDVQGVRPNIRDPEELRTEFLAMKDRVTKTGFAFRGALVMHQEPPGLEILVGAAQDARFGPLMAVGLGGLHAETLKDISFHLAPLTDADARRMLQALRAYPILKGERGEPPRDQDALERVLIKFSRLAADHPEILELEANPFFLYQEGAGGIAVDARVRVQSAPPPGGA